MSGENSAKVATGGEMDLVYRCSEEPVRKLKCPVGCQEGDYTKKEGRFDPLEIRWLPANVRVQAFFVAFLGAFAVGAFSNLFFAIDKRSRLHVFSRVIFGVQMLNKRMARIVDALRRGSSESQFRAVGVDEGKEENRL